MRDAINNQRPTDGPGVRRRSKSTKVVYGGMGGYILTT